uniref:NADH-ubiquinone oxidoreductase chain 5 n=1 Tax=Bilobella aurantiaca TaxID=106915 RepID=B5KMC7_BILAU|nr:NADH dehydrogenase subunit 5 [Bilobella aurantiaca]ABS88970.1 NADH dehydrogenase subunit 5 [Bilobella aurantiaca]
MASYFLVYSMFLLVMSVLFLMISIYMYMFSKVVVLEWEVTKIEALGIYYTILLDWISMSFSSVVMMISSLVFMYSYSYMGEDSSPVRFIMLIGLFVLSMLLMILSPNLVSILLGWDGLGLVSYGLVIYYQNTKSANAGMITILSNRLGDIAILVSIAWVINYGSWDFMFIEVLNKKTTSFILGLVVLASMTKSAQMPFSAWLPAAMAAPTPVSALVHSSTLVTAGVYMLIRFSVLLGVSSVLFYISLLTLLMSGYGALFEYDLKKIIALSTLSQLGVMMLSLSIGLWELAYFHLISHAMFKSLLFLCAGAFIHLLSDTQDIRGLAGVLKSSPLSMLYFVGSSLSICGFPFLAGFYSKDLILEEHFFLESPLFGWSLLMMGVLSTFFYSARLIFYLSIKSTLISVILSFDSDLWLFISMSGLFYISVIIGSLMVWSSLAPLVSVIHIFLKTLVLGLGGSLGGFILFKMIKSNMEGGLGVFSVFNLINLTNMFFGNMWFLYYLSTFNVISKIKLGLTYLKLMDMGWVEYYGGQGGMTVVMKMSTLVDKWGVLYIKLYLFLSFTLVMVMLL